MSTHYLIDAHTPGVDATAIRTGVTPSEINDIRLSSFSPLSPVESSLVNGNFIVRVEAGIQIDDPTSLDDLITKKYAGILANYPGYSNIIFDALLDDANLVLPVSAVSRVGFLRGLRSTIGIPDAYTLINTGPQSVFPTVVTQAIVVWEVYTYSYVDDTTLPLRRFYEEREPTDMIVNFSADGGVTTTPATYGGIITAPTPGTDLWLEFSGTGGDPDPSGNFYLGSWAIIF